MEDIFGKNFSLSLHWGHQQNNPARRACHCKRDTTTVNRQRRGLVPGCRPDETTRAYMGGKPQSGRTVFSSRGSRQITQGFPILVCLHCFCWVVVLAETPGVKMEEVGKVRKCQVLPQFWTRLPQRLQRLKALGSVPMPLFPDPSSLCTSHPRGHGAEGRLKPTQAFPGI